MKLIPQFELPLPAEPLALITQTAVDGDRVARERAQSVRDREENDARQTDYFGPAVYTYTRKQAIEDGVLVDLTEAGPGLVKEAGFKYPVAMTRGAYAETIEAGGIYEDDPNQPGMEVLKLPAGQDVTGRIWDVLWMLKVAISRVTSGDRIAYEVLVQSGHGRSKLKTVRLWSQCGPGDDGAPVITIMLQGED